MKTLFNKIRKENTNLSSLICFIKCLRFASANKKFNKGEKRRFFNELVNKGDYEPESKDEIMEWIYNI